MTEAGILAENPNFPYFDAIEQQRILANLSASAASYYATSKAGGAKGWTLTEAATLNEMPQGPVTFTHPQSHFVIWA